MKQLRQISRKYYFRQIVACWLIWLMMLTMTPVKIAIADVAPPANTVPTGLGVHSGAEITGGNLINTMEITQTAPEAIMNWNNFDIGSDSSVQFMQPGTTSAVLNRVTGSGATGIMGSLSANGRVFVVNPAGVVIGSGANINVAQLVASSLDIADDDFLNGAPYEFISGDGAVINQGSINADSVALIGKMVQNTGTITTTPGGFVAMVAGDRVLLSEPGSKIVVEIDSVASADTISIDGFGDVTAGDVINTETGIINSPEGTIVLAAGDLFSIPLHPQLKVNSGTDESPVYEVDDQPMRVETGIGRVEQLGTIHSDGIAGSGGSVIMTAGDDVYLRSGSLTTANGGFTTDGSISANGGSVIAYAYDFGNTAATTYFEDGALIEVIGGDYDSSLIVGDIAQIDPLTTFNGGLAGINGNHIFFDGTINALATADPYTIEVVLPLDPPQIIQLPRFPSGGTVQVDPVTLTVADGDIPSGGAAMDTVYEKQIENYSNLDVSLDLAADSMITVEYMTDGEIWGGSGDIMMRNVFEDGGIYFVPNSSGQRTTMHTTAGFESLRGGNLFFIGGSGGIVTGDLKTDTLSNDKISDPGRIRLLTTNGGDMEVGSMIAERGNITEISAISSGNLTVNGEVISNNQVVDKQDRSIGFSRICLVAGDDIYIDAEDGPIEVTAHGKIISFGEIIICAGKDIVIENLGRDGINAEAKTSQNSPITTAYTDVTIAAGGNKTGPSTITINGTTYDSTSDILTLPVYLEARASGAGSSLRVDPSNNNTKTSENTWEYSNIEPDNYDLSIKLIINDAETIPPGEPGSPCYECPKPEGLPPVPHIFWIMDDFVTTFNKTTLTEILTSFLLSNDDNGGPLDGEISEFFDTTNGGTLTPVYDNGDIIGFEYTPPVDAVYVVDSQDPSIAYYIDTFKYKATDSEGAESLNKATVTITVKNNVPVAQPDEYTEGHNVLLEADGSPAGVIEGVVPATMGDYDLDTEDSLAAIKASDPAYGTLVLNPDGTFTYTPSATNTSGSDSFTYYVTDGYNDSATVTVNINLTNADPIANNDAYESGHNVLLDITDVEDGTIEGILPGMEDIDPDNEVTGKLFDDELTAVLVDGPLYGSVVFNADGTFTYTPSQSNTSGSDTFTYRVSDDFGGTSNVATVTVTLTNAAPIANDDAYESGHNVLLDITDVEDGTIEGILPGMEDIDPDNEMTGKLFDDELTAELVDGPLYGSVVFNADGTFTYTPSQSNTSGSDAFTYRVSDDLGGTSNVATVTVTLTNISPIAQPDSYETVQDVPLIIVNPYDVITGVNPEINGDYDPDNENEARLFDDILSAILVGGGTTALGGSITLNADGSFTYTPPAGVSGLDSFSYHVTDSYNNSNTVLVTITIGTPPPPPMAAPLPQWHIPSVEGCPVLTQAAAMELGIAGETLQVAIGNSLAVNTNVQACQACSSLVNAASILRDIDGSRMAAMVEVFNTAAPADAPYTPEMATSIAMAFEDAAEGSQYASAMEFIDAFVQYVAALELMGSPVGDSTAFVMDKYGAGFSENENMATFVAERIESGETF